MAVECSQEAVLDFLKEKGGKVKNSELIEHFKTVFSEDPQRRAALRNRFKEYVDTVAYVKTEDGVKYVCMKKKFRGSVKLTEKKEPPSAGEARDCVQVSADDVAEDPAPRSPGSGYGSDCQVRVPHVFVPDNREDRGESDGSVSTPQREKCGSEEMGNRVSFHRTESKKERTERARDIPEISVIQASPLPADGSMFNLPGPAETAPSGQVEPGEPVETLTLEGLREVEVVMRRGRREEEEEEEEEEDDAHSLSGSEGSSSPIGSRKHFIQVMMSSSPQVRRSMVIRGSVHLSSRSDSDTASMLSGLDEDRNSVTLDPLEHQWMMCASDGEWGSLFPLLAEEPSLILRKDFITGFTCLHWAAKHGKPELIAMIINFAKQHNVPISVDARSNTGYTPLHVAAMHNHMEVVKLLVGAYGADVEIRDYSGRKACQYLTDSVSVDIRDIIGAYDSRSQSENAQSSEGARWKFSKVLQTNLKPRRLLQPEDCDSLDGEDRPPREKPLRRKSSLSRMRPKLQRLRVRTSQIIHSTSFGGHDELEISTRGSFRSRPKTSFFG
ncbi:ankyrin repeat domain-containing protein SOWAHC-like [Xyrichtys novacula]|uniref:Ankyrin repeat domain-containing protein SOWAHC-like n=1 Tax=Xyrichtys novacula TaxID=13765 RepID=A0AAV1HMW6_XYRNO|nr:ankyrin repeat domain-containing protein SOWAHC-like [Xyrichtys novacula]